MQYKCDALSGRRRIEQDQQGHADRIGKDGVFLGTFAGSDCYHVATRVIRRQVLAAAFAPLQRIEADARDSGREPRFEICDARNVRAADLQPGLLERIVGFGSRSQYSPSRFTALDPS